MFHFPFLEWFSIHPLVGGDWKFLWNENILDILNYSYAWDPGLNGGLGLPNLFLLSLNSYLAYGAYFLSILLHIPWSIAEKILFFVPIIILSFISGYLFLKLVTRKILLQILGGILYLTNTYALMIFSGGQVGIALAYSIFPIVLLKWIQLIDFVWIQKRFPVLALFRRIIILSFVMALAVVFESRIFYLCIIAVGLYVMYLQLFSDVHDRWKQTMQSILFSFVIPGIIVALLHSYWILPMLLYKAAPNFKASTQGAEYILSYFSFAKLENTFSLLHPNWPENIFGKVYFMRVEFIIIPIIAFLFIFLITIHTKRNELRQNNFLILFIAILSIIGAFLAKGTNEPFGELYMLLYNFFPGLVMFRDPTKFYIFVAFSYSILIPFTIEKVQDFFNDKRILTKNMYKSLLIVFLLFWFFTIRSVFVPGLSGTFIQHPIPDEYIKLKNLIVSQNNFSRTLWIPSLQRFGFSSSLHPALSTNEFFATDSATVIAQNLNNKKVQERLAESGIQYVIIPLDSEKEIFLSDRKYDKKLFEKYVSAINSVEFLHQDKSFSKLHVYQTNNHYQRIFAYAKGAYIPISYKTIDPTTYEITISNAKQNDAIIFSEAYNPNWKLFFDKSSIPSTKYKNELNSFILNKSGTYKAKIYFEPQNGVIIGKYFSLITLVVCCIYLFAIRKEKL